MFAITAGRPLTPHTGMRYGVAEPGHGVGASAYAELTALFSVIGTPAWACIEVGGRWLDAAAGGMAQVGCALQAEGDGGIGRWRRSTESAMCF